MHRVLDLGSTKHNTDQCQQYVPNTLFSSPDTIRQYWEKTLQTVDIPRGNHDSLSIAAPYYYNCLNRSVIIDILTSHHGIDQCNILPRPLALLLGYLAQHPQDVLHGNLLCILIEEDRLNFSFISLTGSAITLEYQGFGNWEQLQTSAETLALRSSRGWEFDHLLYTNSSSADNLHVLISEHQNVNLLKVEDVGRTILEGLHYSVVQYGTARARALRIVYPYDFYLQKYDPHQKRLILEKIPFDTANLELDLQGSYRIARLPLTELHSSSDENYIEFTVYEINRYFAPEPSICPPAMTFRGRKEDLPDSLELWFNMDAAIIYLGSESQPYARATTQTADLLFRLHNSQQNLGRLLESSSNQHLLKDLKSSISSPFDPRHESLDQRLETTRLKLYALLQLWSGK